MRWMAAPGQRLQALQRERQVSAALGGNEGVNLVDDDRVDGAQSLGGLRGEQQVERLGRGDENLGGMAGKAGALPLRRVAGANADGRFAEGNAHAAGHVGHAGQGRAQIALHVDGQSLEGRNVDDAAAFALRSARSGWSIRRSRHQRKAARVLPVPVGARIERALPAGDHRPAQPLRGGGGVKDSAKPGCRDRMEAGKRIGSRDPGWAGRWTCSFENSAMAKRKRKTEIRDQRSEIRKQSAGVSCEYGRVALSR